VAVNSVHTRVEFSQGLAIGYRPETFVSRWSAEQPNADDFQPVLVRHSTLLLQDPPASGQPPAGYVFQATSLGSAAPVYGQAEALAARLDGWVQAALRGEAPNESALADALYAASGT
jgi:hypothetical protein